jgi:hypothetical protein
MSKSSLPTFTAHTFDDLHSRMGEGAPLRNLRPLSFPKIADDRGGSAQMVVEKAIERLESLVDEETAALRSMAKVDLKDFSNRKSQGLLELTHAMRALPAGEAQQVLRPQLKSLRAKLEVNQSVLKMHVEAVQEVAMIMATAIRDFESDGTYSQTFRSDGTAR